jgi:ABC-type transporter MlaC component
MLTMWLRWTFAACALCWSVFAAAQQSADPNAVVKSAVENVIRASQADPAAKTGDIAAMSKVVEREFLPFTDFARTTRLAVGSDWQNATPEQREQLVVQFTQLLVHSYASQLTQMSGQDMTFSYKPAVINGSDAVVAAQVKSGADVNDVQYRLGKTPAGWRIYDIDMQGMWLIQVYQKQFGASLANGGIPALIKRLTDHNARFAK